MARLVVLVVMAVLVLVMVPQGSIATASSAKQTCESALINLETGALELERLLKRCHAEERIKCDSRMNTTHAELGREKDVSLRLRELLQAKDVEKKMMMSEMAQKHEEVVR